MNRAYAFGQGSYNESDWPTLPSYKKYSNGQQTAAATNPVDLKMNKVGSNILDLKDGPRETKECIGPPCESHFAMILRMRQNNDKLVEKGLISQEECDERYSDLAKWRAPFIRWF